MANEDFDIMKPISAELDIEPTIFDETPPPANPAPDTRYIDTQYGFATKEEAALFSSISESTDQSDSYTAMSGTLNKYESYNSVANIPPQLRGVVNAENEERKNNGEWLPNRKVYYNGQEVHGKKKNRTIVFMIAVIGFIVAVVIASYIFA